jgi:hypothetical protein
MTVNEIVEYYVNLLIIQYANKAKARATIDALVRPVVMDKVTLDVQEGFNLDTAVGSQLDMIAKYVGVTRSASTLSGYTTLSDEDFRTLIKFGVVQNNGESSLYEIQTKLNIFFAGFYSVYDYKNMQMSYAIDTQVGSSQLAEMLVTQGLLPRPAGVSVSALIYIPNLSGIFGFCDYFVQPSNISGMSTYASYSLASPWLSYSNAIYG